MYLTSTKSETRPTVNIHEFINYALDCDVNNPYVTMEDIVIGMFDEGDDATNNKPFEEPDNVQIGDVVVEFMDIGSAIVTLKKKTPNNVTHLIESNRTFQKEIRSWYAQKSHQITLELFLHYG